MNEHADEHASWMNSRPAWTLVYYGYTGGQYRVSGAAPIPDDVEKRKRDGAFLVECDAVCRSCGYIQHPPEGGECPMCGVDGEIDFENVQVERD